jgi:hypothetical protein
VNSFVKIIDIYAASLELLLRCLPDNLRFYKRFIDDVLASHHRRSCHWLCHLAEPRQHEYPEFKLSGYSPGPIELTSWTHHYICNGRIETTCMRNLNLHAGYSSHSCHHFSPRHGFWQPSDFTLCNMPLTSTANQTVPTIVDCLDMPLIGSNPCSTGHWAKSVPRSQTEADRVWWSLSFSSTFTESSSELQQIYVTLLFPHPRHSVYHGHFYLQWGSFELNVDCGLLSSSNLNCNPSIPSQIDLVLALLSHQLVQLNFWTQWPLLPLTVVTSHPLCYPL